MFAATKRTGASVVIAPPSPRSAIRIGAIASAVAPKVKPQYDRADGEPPES
jgi:hypothetical protein